MLKFIQISHFQLPRVSSFRSLPIPTLPILTLSFLGIPFLAFSFLVIAFLAFLSPAHAASLERASFTNFLLETLDTAIFWLQLVPSILNLALVITSLYLMLDGIRRWGHNKSGAFSRTLIGLFILHSSSCAVPFLPYLALFLEIWLCARGLEARTAARIAANREKRLVMGERELGTRDRPA